MENIIFWLQNYNCNLAIVNLIWSRVFITLILFIKSPYRKIQNWKLLTSEGTKSLDSKFSPGILQFSNLEIISSYLFSTLLVYQQHFLLSIHSIFIKMLPSIMNVILSFFHFFNKSCRITKLFIKRKITILYS